MLLLVEIRRGTVAQPERNVSFTPRISPDVDLFAVITAIEPLILLHFVRLSQFKTDFEVDRGTLRDVPRRKREEVNVTIVYKTTTTKTPTIV